MNRFLSLPLIIVTAIMAASCSRTEVEPQSADRLFELRVYYPHPGKLDALNTRFREHTVGLFEKHGMQNIGYWTTKGDDSVLVYLLAFENLAAREQAWKDFLNDPDWKAAYAASIVNGNLVAKIDSTLLRLTDYSPQVEKSQANPQRLFELRTYKATEGKLQNLDARFRDHTLALFEKHGATNLAYFHIESGNEGADDTLIYFLAHESEAARDAMFAAFREDPDWKAAREASEQNAGGSLTQPGGVSSQLLDPTDYSMIK